MESIEKIDIEFIKEKKRILGELLRSGKIEPGQLINYAQFKCLYALYKYTMNEREFFEMLQINVGTFRQMKHEGGKGRVLRNLKVELERIKAKQRTNLQEACIEMLNKYKELGLTREQAIKSTEEMLGITPEEMIKIRQDYQVEQKKVEAVQNEEISIG